jgi:hypothetical protein
MVWFGYLEGFQGMWPIRTMEKGEGIHNDNMRKKEASFSGTLGFGFPFK